MFQITAIICTHNRYKYVGKAIDSLMQQHCADYEIIVVDNKSTDETKEIIATYINNSPVSLKYIYEPKLGLSVARNRGAIESSSPILAYLDDDAIASPSWLQTIVNAYQDNHKIAIAGGKVTLILPEGFNQLPYWISDNLASSLGAYDLGTEVIYLQNSNLTPRGLNYSARKSFWQEIGGFAENLGRVGNNLLSNEELLMTEQALAKNLLVAYLPEAMVAHHVITERLQPSWFFRRSWYQGISEYYREVLATETTIDQYFRGGERIIRGLYKSLKYFGNSADSFDNLVYAYGQLGYLSAVLQHDLKKLIRT